MLPLTLVLNDLAATELFGQALAKAVAEASPGALLLYGGLGAGKTTLTRNFVSALPGGDAAEVASPSFTICNIYGTIPPVNHFDLYRLNSGLSDASLEESFDDSKALTIVEWPDRLPADALPAVALLLRLSPGVAELSRLLECSARGADAERCLAVLYAQYL